jgi:hypothetical protein
MSSYLDRMRAHMEREAQRLRHMANASREFDHKGNRGSEAEHALASWLQARFSPLYTASSGEIIDSFDTNASVDSRQQDVVLHSNDADANRFLLPSGKRLLPIESVVASIEIKLALDAAKFQEADATVSEVAQLRLRPTQHAELVLSDDLPNVSLRSVSDDQSKNGVAAADPAFV